jgi:hypothetical protein
MKYWIIKTYKRSRNEIIEWLNGLDPNHKQTIETFIRRLEIIEKWDSKYFKPVTGYHGIYEIKIRYRNVQYRPLGCYGPGRKEFTLLIGAKEIGDAFVPKNAPEKAQERCKLIHVDTRYIDDF